MDRWSYSEGTWNKARTCQDCKKEGIRRSPKATHTWYKIEGGNWTDDALVCADHNATRLANLAKQVEKE